MATKTDEPVVVKEKFSLKGWNLGTYMAGRKKLLVTIVGAVATFIVTNDPTLSGMVGAGSELAFALIEYFVKERTEA